MKCGSKRLTAQERERGLLVCVRLEWRRPGRSQCSVGSGSCSFAWSLLPERAALDLLVTAVRTALNRVGAARVWVPDETEPSEFRHSPWGRAPAEVTQDDAAQPLLFEEARR